MDEQKEARKREPSDMQTKKGEKTFEIINYYQNYKTHVKKTSTFNLVLHFLKKTKIIIEGSKEYNM